MAEIKENFNSITELYVRLLPAIRTKLSELKREKVIYISETDIWNYCLNNKWKAKKDLRLYEMVDDILNLDILNMEVFIKKIDRTE